MSINWTNLVAQGRAKEIGVSWGGDCDTPGTEMYARFILHIPAEYVRSGCLTNEQFDKVRAADEKGAKPLERMTRKELEVEAKALGANASHEAPDVVVRESIRGKKAKHK